MSCAPLVVLNTATRAVSYVAWDLVLQRLLLRVLLPHVDNTRYQSVKHMWDQYYRKDNDYDTYSAQ
jgi:hypothetical protein